MSLEPKLAAGPNGKRTRRGPRTRQHILDASLRLFSERGFARTTVRDIARQAGITDAAIYYHFQSKRELLEALVEERGFVNSLEGLERVSGDLPLYETLLRMARGAINIMDENREFLRLILLEGLGADEAATEQYQRLADRWESGLVSVLERYVGKGELPGDDVQAMARQIIYTILMAFEDSLLGRHVSPRDTPPQRQERLAGFVSTALEHLLSGFGAPPGQSSVTPAPSP
ncbi:MAG TPA: helix-turn-helix domain-containing protein [Dehalococcoidia bacterium]|nr:helix-turn-helix domain-containing protein [Dehalococcoidia bacterium]